MNVVLPAPLGPISAWRAPASSLKSISLHGHERAEMAAQRLRLQPNFGHDRRTPCAVAPPQRLAEAQNSVARKQRDHDQEEPEAELPGGRIDPRQEVLQRQVGDGADEGAVEPPIAAENENDEHGRRTIEIERAKIDIGVGLRPQAAGDAGDRRRDGVADDEPAPHRRSDRMHAQQIFADAGQALTERRIDQRAHEEKADQQDGEGIEILRVGIKRVEFEHAEHRRNGQARQAVEAAGIVVRHVRGLVQGAPWCTT